MHAYVTGILITIPYVFYKTDNIFFLYLGWNFEIVVKNNIKNKNENLHIARNYF